MFFFHIFFCPICFWYICFFFFYAFFFCNIILFNRWYVFRQYNVSAYVTYTYVLQLRVIFKNRRGKRVWAGVFWIGGKHNSNNNNFSFIHQQLFVINFNFLDSHYVFSPACFRCYVMALRISNIKNKNTNKAKEKIKNKKNDGLHKELEMIIEAHQNYQNVKKWGLQDSK